VTVAAFPGHAGRVVARASRLTAPIVGLAVVLIGLEALSRSDVIPRQSFPPVTEIFDRLWDLLRTSEYWLTIGRTLRAWGIAMVIGALIAVPLGMLIGSSRTGYLASKLTIDFLRPIPSVALIPLLVLIYGTRPTLKITLAVIGAVFPLLFQSMYGVRDVDPVARDTARSFGLTRWQRVRAVVLPTCGPFLLTGLRISSSIALILVVTGEYIVGIPGIGQATFLAQNSAAYQSMYAWVVTAGVIGLLLNSGFQFAERRVLFWHESQRGARS
jgi:ABC-type nitrate/sulfonate/bicarbonate transport system permease component